MDRVKSFFNVNKLKILFILFILIFVILFGFPSFARFKNRTNFTDNVVWDGTIASSYNSGTGTEENPYIISNGQELAYLSSQLQSTNYEGTYFKISNDIMLNKGILSYDRDNGLSYILDNNTYYIKPYTNEYYSDDEFNNIEGTINIFPSFDTFKGTLLGDSYTIYGLYITSNTSDEVSLFTNLEGNISELYIENTLVYGGNITACVAANANNANLESIICEGKIVGNDNLKNANLVVSLDNLNYQDEENKIDISKKIIGNIISSKLTGTISNNIDLNEVNVYINETLIENNDFEIDLGTKKYSSILVTSDESIEFEITDLKYTVNYEYALASGIIAYGNNVQLKNIINKASIYSSFDAGGIITEASNITIKQSYNIGEITSINAGGLINSISNSTNKVSIIDSYNSGKINATSYGNFINMINNNKQLNITNVFDTNINGYFINKIDSSIVTLNNVYAVSSNNVLLGSFDGTITNISLENLKDKTFVKGSLSFYEFVDLDNLSENSGNVWVYVDDSFPILYIDDIINPLINIHASKYTWNDLSYKLKEYRFKETIMFNVEEYDSLKPVKEIYYYIHNAKKPLNKEDIKDIVDWIKYEDVSQIKNEGFYIIYVKAVDYNDNIYYANSDLLVLDLSGSNINISLDDKSWNIYNDNLSYLYIDKEKQIEVSVVDEFSGVKSIEYYISDNKLLDADLELVNWTKYEEKIEFDSKNPKIIYIKAIDNCDYISYANTDFITLNGYKADKVMVGKNTVNDSDSLRITNNSTISYVYKYKDSIKLLANEVHSVISNVLLPKGTNITIINLNNNDIYSYKIDTENDIYSYDKNNYAVYNFSLFKNNAKLGVDDYFDENNYNQNDVNDNFKVVIDFKDVSLESNIDNINIYLAITKDNVIVRNTLNNENKKFNIIKIDDTTNDLYIKSDYDGDGILLNSNSSIDIDIEAGIKDKIVNSYKVINTTYENKKIGIMVKIFDSSNNQINKKDIKNLVISVDNVEYAPDEKGVFRICLSDNLDVVNKTLNIRTTEDNIKIPNGTYYLKINSYAAYDGLYSNDISISDVVIPINVSANQTNIKYYYDVKWDDSFRIISDDLEKVSIDFEIFEDGPFTNPNVRVSLYKKEKLTAYDQNYIPVNLKNYINTNITNLDGYVYYAVRNAINGSTNNFTLDLIPSAFENTGYKLVFDLYDGDFKIGTIEKKFIVR